MDASKGCAARRGPAHGGFMEACLLCLLRDQPSYGYGLMEGLDRFALDTDNLSPSVIYRNLRGMEERGLIRSRWADSDQGPRKRMYAITQEGEEALADWVSFLKERQKTFAAIVGCYEKQKR